MSNNKQVNNFEISGKTIHVGQPEQYVNRNNVTKSSRILVLEVFSGNYANDVIFEFAENNMNQLLQIKEGEWVTVNFQLKGSKSIKDGKARWYPRLEGLTCLKG
jgi:hypothetical protein